jgi:methylated-DNA-protein-cysteine methyltransferase-like protein
MNRSEFTEEVIAIIRAIPPGKVVTYGQIAAMAGHPRNTRGVVWILHACSEADDLPWFRVVNREGRISLPPGRGYERQKALLAAEGIRFDRRGRIDLKRYLWSPVPL